MAMKYIPFLFSVLLLSISLRFTITSAAHSPPAPAAAAPTPAPAALPLSPPEPKVLPAAPPSGHADITKILQKAGGFTVLLRLMKSTHVADQINSQLEDLNDGLTVFAPTDSAFTSLRNGALNKLSDKEQVELMQYHVIPTLLTMSQFETVSNPLMTKAGGSRKGEFPLNVTSNGDKVTLYTDTNEASVEQTLYIDNRLAVYQVDKVLLPQSIFPKGLGVAMAPAATEPKQQQLAAETSSASKPIENLLPAIASATMGVALFAVFSL